MHVDLHRQARLPWSARIACPETKVAPCESLGGVRIGSCPEIVGTVRLCARNVHKNRAASAVSRTVSRRPVVCIVGSSFGWHLQVPTVIGLADLVNPRDCRRARIVSSHRTYSRRKDRMSSFSDLQIFVACHVPSTV